MTQHKLRSSPRLASLLTLQTLTLTLTLSLTFSLHFTQTPLMGLAKIFAVFFEFGLCLNAKEFWWAGARLRGLEEREVGWERGIVGG